MNGPWMPPVRWIVGAATLLGFSSALQAYRLQTLAYKPPDVTFADLLILNLVYWYIPAALTRPIFRLAHWIRAAGWSWGRAAAVHIPTVLGYSLLHAACMLATRSLIWENGGKPPTLEWPAYVQRPYLGNLDWALMTYTTIVGVSYAIAYYQESQTRAIRAAQLETRLVEARLRTLEAELHPHFLFNTLHAISTLVHSQPEAADRMISRLSDLLRLTFDRSGAPRIPLHDEVEFLQKYLEIEQTRFQDRLTVEYDIDPHTLDAEVPRLILQPLVENAIKHGVSPKPGPGLVRVSARRLDDRLELEVRDNGSGPGERTQLHGGVGLANTRNRLECLYGTAQRLDMTHGSDGFSVRLEIPFRLADARGQTAIRVA